MMHFFSMTKKDKGQGSHPPVSEADGPDISNMIERSGCSVQYYSLETCLGEKDRDFRKCQEEVNALRKCYEKKPQR